MSKLTVPEIINNSTIFRVWMETINGIIDEELEIYDILETKAPIAHATQGTMYGVGTPLMYGHLKLIDEIDPEMDSSYGTAPSPMAVYGMIQDFTERLDAMEEAFYASLQELRTDMQEQIDNLNEEVSGKAPIYHASTEETYGKGNAVLYGHLRLSDARSPLYGVDDGIAATPAAVQSAYDDAVAYVDSFDINTRFDAVNRRIDANVVSINELAERLGTAEENIQELQENLMVGLETLFFYEDTTVDSSKIKYGVYVFKNAIEEKTLFLKNCRQHFKISVANESEFPLRISASDGFTINEDVLPVVLGKGDTASFVQNPISNSGVVNWTIIGRETAMQGGVEKTASSICSINMASERAERIEVAGPTSIEFIPGSASSENYCEYAEKNILFIALSSNSTLTWPDDVIWMDAFEPPVWGLANGETLMIKAYQFGDKLLLEQKHNSHIVPGLDREVVRSI